LPRPRLEVTAHSLVAARTRAAVFVIAIEMRNDLLEWPAGMSTGRAQEMQKVLSEFVKQVAGLE
jgi:hypothetical protein